MRGRGEQRPQTPPGRMMANLPNPTYGSGENTQYAFQSFFGHN